MQRFFLLCFLMWVGSAQAQEFVPWKGAPPVQRARFDAAGTRVAFHGDDKLSVHRVGPNVSLGAQVYTSKADERVLSFAWWGSGILVSRFKNGRGETVRVLPGDTKTPEKLVLPLAGNWVLPSPRGNRIAITPANEKPSGDASQRATIEFYERVGETWKKSGACIRRDVGGLGTSFNFQDSQLYLVDWAFDGSGIFAVIPYELSRSNDRVLALVTPKGRAFDLTSQNAPLIPERRDGLPLISPLPRGPWPTYGFSTVPISTVGPLDRPVTNPGQLLPATWKYSTLIAWLPDGRSHLFQKAEEGELEGSTAPLCVVDAEARTRQIMAAVPLIRGAYGWSGDRLLVRVSSAGSGTPVWGTLRVAPDAQRFEEVEFAPTAEEIAARPALEFLKRPDIAASTNLKFHTESPDENGFRTLRLSYQTFDSVKIEIKTGRIAGYRGPAPRAPLPDVPISVQQAQSKAEGFARAFNPAFLEGAAPVISVGKLNEQMHFPVRFTRAANGWIEVEVRAGDGKIGGYRESAALSENEKRYLDREQPFYVRPPFSEPVFSPDATQIAFCATRPTPGYPQWWSNRPSALWVVSSGGGAPKLIATEVITRARWSPDSRHLAFSRGGEIMVADVQTGKSVAFPAPPSRSLAAFLIGWKNAGEALLGWTHNGPGSTDLLSWKPATPTTPPQILVRDWTNRFGNEDGLRGATLSPDGATLAIAFEKGFQSPITLWKLPINNLDATPAKISADIRNGYYPVWTRAGIFSFSMNGTSQTDPATGKSIEWKAPAVLDTIRGRAGTIEPTTQFAISPDGKALAFAAFTDPAKRTGYTLFIADFDGQNPHPLFPASPP